MTLKDRMPPEKEVWTCESCDSWVNKCRQIVAGHWEGGGTG